jgi:hypothetical protein
MLNKISKMLNEPIDLNKQNEVGVSLDRLFEPVDNFFYSVGKRWDKLFGIEVPDSYRTQQRFYNHLRGKPRILDANGNLYVMIGDSKYYL